MLGQNVLSSRPYSAGCLKLRDLVGGQSASETLESCRRVLILRSVCNLSFDGAQRSDSIGLEFDDIFSWDWVRLLDEGGCKHRRRKGEEEGGVHIVGMEEYGCGCDSADSAMIDLLGKL